MRGSNWAMPITGQWIALRLLCFVYGQPQCYDRHSRSGSSWDNARGFVHSQLMLHLPWELPPPETKGSPKRCSPTPRICKNKWINDQSMGTCSSTHLTPPGDLLKCSGLKKWSGLEMLIHVDNGMKQILRTWGSPSNSSATEHLSIKSKKQGWETRLYKNGGVRHKPPVRQMALPGILHPCASPEVSGSLKFQGNCTELVDFKPTLRIWKRFILIAPWQISSAGGW